MADAVLGLGDLTAKFKQLSADTTRVARLMVVSGGRIVRDEAKAIIRANGSIQTGTMVRNVVVKRDRAAPKGEEWLNVGVRHGRHLTKKQKAGATLAVRGSRIVKVNKNDPWYYFLVEYTGAQPHHIGKGSYTQRKNRPGRGKQLGRVHPGFKPKPFLRPALERKKADVIAAMSARLDAELKKAQK